MSLVRDVLLICLLIQATTCMRNYYFPHPYMHGLGMHNYYPHSNYEDSGSESVVLRSHRDRYHRYKANSDYSDSDNNYNRRCRCSCTKCRKPKPKPCCKDFCVQQCPLPNNIFVVPYPVPFVVLNQSAPDATAPTPWSSTTSTRESTSITTTSKTTSRTKGNEEKMHRTRSTAVFLARGYPQPKRFRIVPDKRRRSMSMRNNDIRPAMFKRLPKYGIVPIPEKLAIRLMQQMRDDGREYRYDRQQANVDRNVL